MYIGLMADHGTLRGHLLECCSYLANNKLL